MRRRGQANKALAKILKRANETFTGPDVIPQFFLQCQWFSATK